MRGGRPDALAAAAAMGAALFAAGAGHAGPDPVAVTLDYSAVSGCPDARLFRKTVAKRLGYEVFSESAPSRVLVTVISEGQAFEGRMEWRDPQGHWAGDRTFPSSSSDCEDLVRAMAFTLALQIQLSAATNATEPESEPTAEPQPAPPVPPAQDAPVPKVPSAQPAEPPQGPGSRPLLAFGAGTLIGFDMSSSVVPFGRIFGSVAWHRGSLFIGAEASLPATIRRSDGAGFSHQQLLASVAGCGNLGVWSACLLIKAGGIRVSGKDIDEPASANGPVLETGLRAGAMLRIFRPLYVSASAEALVLPILWSVTLDQSVVWTSPRFAETLGLDLVLRFE